MDKNLVGRSAEVAPLIARLNAAQQTYKQEKEKNDSIRSQLAEAVMAVLDMQASDRETELVADVLIELMRQAESDLRQALSEQLSIVDKVPLRLILQLANDDIEIARPVLTKSKVLRDMDLIYIIKSKTPEYWQAIASRHNLGTQVIDMLADTKDFDTAVALAENMNIILSDYTVVALSDMAQGHETLAVPLLRRGEVPKEIARVLYEFVGTEMKNFISNNFDIDHKQVSTVIDRTVEEFAHGAHQTDFMPEEYMLNAAKAFQQKGMLNPKLMLSTLRRGHIRSFVAQFSVFSEMPVVSVCQILSQTNGQGLAIAAKAFHIEKQDFVSMFMMTAKIRDHGRMVEMEEIRKAVSYFNLIKAETALQIIKDSTRH